MSSVHGSAVRVGDRAVLIRGASGAGKSRLALQLILAGRGGVLPPTVLIGDDRLYLAAGGDGLRVTGAPELAGLLEVRGLGIRRCPAVDSGLVALVVDLDAADAARLPDPAALSVALAGVSVPRLPVGTGVDALPLVVAALTLPAAP